MRWDDTPVPLPAKPGLVRWGAVEGATAYDVWYPDIRKVVRTHTNVADQREFYSFHLEDSWWQLVRWRVRPVRQVVGALPNGLPGGLVRSVEPDVRDDESRLGGRKAASALRRIGRDQHGVQGLGSSAHAGVHVHRGHGKRRS